MASNSNEKLPAQEPQRPQQREKPPKKPFPRPKGRVPKDMKFPQPGKKKTESTTLTNDPLWQESFILDGETGLANSKPVQEFEADAAGYVALVEEEYKAINDCDKNYGKSIPASAHAYYHHILWWYKIALLAQKHGNASVAQMNLVRFVEGYSCEMAAGAATYLSGLGDYEDATGVKHILVTQEPNAEGHFGRATAATHASYEYTIAPAFSLQRVSEDVDLTRERNPENRDAIWDIEGIRPVGGIPPADNANAQAEQAAQRRRGQARRQAEAPAQEEIPGAAEDAQQAEEKEEDLHPTVNLLGWRPATLLVKDQANQMFDIFPQDHAPHQVIPTYSLVRGLFELVHWRIRECKRYKMVVVPTNTNGSVAQQATWTPDEEDVGSPRRQFMHGMGQINSRTMLPLRVAVAAKVMAYRAIRRETDVNGILYNPWCCYSFNGYQEVPMNWRANRNTRAIRGNTGLILGDAPFTSTYAGREASVIEFLNKFKTPVDK